MPVEINEGNLKRGVLGLVMALVEIIRDTLQRQALKRVEAGSLGPEEIERLGRALCDLDRCIEEIKVEQGLEDAVRAVREGLDELIQRLVDGLVLGGEETYDER